MSQATSTIHQFELSGMGKAPFKLIGLYSIPSPALGEQNPMAYQAALQAMPSDVAVGSCHHCSTPLVHNFILLSADKKKSVVGCDCVAKVGDAGLVDAIKAKKREVKREQRLAEKQAAYQAELDEQRNKNGGKTDAEMYREAVDARQARIDESMMSVLNMLAPMIKAMKASYGSFAFSMYELLSQGRLAEVSNNMLNIILDMSAKHLTGSRKGSKAFVAKRDEMAMLFDDAKARHEAIMKANPPITR